MPVRNRAAALALATALLTTAPLALAPAAQALTITQTAQSGLRFTDIPGSDGVVLKGNVYEPADGAARHPLVVLPSSWGVNDLEYLAQAKQLAEAGYVVVSYTPRGFWGSGGQIEVAGPPDVADLSKVIDWALANTSADPARIGAAGISYGAGISLLGSAFDPRIKAVAALSGWADLADSLFSDETQHLQSAGVLAIAGYLTGRPGSELQEQLTAFFGSDFENEAKLRAWAAKRSAATYLDRINANGAAVLLANAWGDSIFPPNQLTGLYEKLTGPKRLELRPGDHATAEATGLAGLPNDVWSTTHAWLDHYLKGTDNGIDRAKPVRLKPQLQDGYEEYASWAAVTGSTRRLGLGERNWLNTGSLAAGTDTGWRTPIATGLDSGADGGVVFLSNLAEQFLKLPPLVSVPLLPRPVAAVWQSEAYPTRQQLRGTVQVHLGVTPSASRGSLVAYLYDVDALGIGKLITHAPYTFLDHAAPLTADFPLQATAYDVPAGHRLALVVDTVDPLYITHNPAWSSLTFTSPAADPSWVSIPLRG
ncbi:MULTISPECIES: CocE/NonD family hydrolase [unclassified Kitasatospora]|uniref:CocE/NonD family hydrolase n=1 Tax=unclassified Kitasatospora TaxID=2633591 RepID=UPI00070D46E5|nr:MULTISPECIES: CocE/NonD family hydrolase [unclassified Kitasatospora]KQV04677.1 acyl esterase [Kitasatospora sp. Root107]KRB60798.1 acyl esterase [Kitasatospora sp. Root187]